jgi:actin-related protein 6
LLRERQEEERRRREQEAEQQVLHVSVERFAIPEVLFRPSDAGLPREWANLPQAVVQSIEACPLIYRAALYQSIQLTGGLSQLNHIAERLEQEVRALAPTQYKVVKVTAPSKESGSPVEAAWRGANQLVMMQPCGEWSMGQEEGRGAWKRLLWSEGGNFV